MSVTNEEQVVSGGGGVGITGQTGSSSSSSATTTTTTAPATITSATSTNNIGSLNLSGFFDHNGGINNYHNHASNNISGGGGSGNDDDVVRSGYLRKYKGRKKFFVLRKETESGPARLEYYANERKFRMGQPPRKSIVLKACFNINRTDSKYKFAIALHTHNDCVRITMNSEDEMNDWLRLMNYYGEEETEEIVGSPTGPTNKPHFEHVWLVTALNKGLGSQENILGSYRLCLTSKELTLLKVGDHDEKNSVLKFPLNVIRNVSHDAAFGCFFHIEFGRFACTGAGKLSLKTEDNNIGQNMHMLILKAWQNYSKDEQIPSKRDRTNTWTYSSGPRSGSFSITPPGILPRIQSVDSQVGRIRTESMSSSTERHGVMSGMSSPPVPIHTPTSMSYSTAGLGSASSASSSISTDYGDNNNNSGGGVSSHVYSKSQDDESYVPWNPSDQPGIHSLTLPIHADQSDYVETSIAGNTANVNGTPSSSYMEMQSPLSHIPMSPAGAMMGVKSGGKMSVSHSRNSSILMIEDHDYVPHTHSHSQSESTTGSTTGLDENEAYLDMDFSRKLNLSNDDMRRMSPASSESVQSETPSSLCTDYPLEKVSSYLQSDDFEDGSIAMRPTRAYSVGSDASSTGAKSRLGKNRLEAVQETYRVRAMSVGSKHPPRKVVNPSSNTCGLSTVSISSLTASRSGTPLSSSWGSTSENHWGSVGRWPKFPVPSSSQQPPNSTSVYPHVHHQTQVSQESGDSDLMELDFTHNKQKSRKRSLPNGSLPGGNLSSSSSTGSATALQQISPCPRNLVCETPPSIETPDTPKSTSFSSANFNASPRYASSAPISIQRKTHECGSAGFLDSSTTPILTRLSGFDVNKLKELDDNGAYLDMDLSKPGLITATTTQNNNNNPIPSASSTITKPPPSSSVTMPILNDKLKSDRFDSSSSSSNYVIKANENVPAKFNVSSSTHAEPPSLSRSLSTSSNFSTTSSNSSTSCVSVKSQQNAERSVPLTLNLSSSSTPSSVAPTITTTTTIQSPSVTVTTTVPQTMAAVVTPTNSSNLSRIEESPEKHSTYVPSQNIFTKAKFGKLTNNKSKEDGHQATYQHLPQATCGKQSQNSTSKFSSVNCPVQNSNVVKRN